MDDQSAVDIVAAIGDLKTDVATRIGDLKTSVAKDIGVVNTTVEKYHADLNARMLAVESDTASQKKWGRINTLLVPVYAFAHGFAAHWGIKI